MVASHQNKKSPKDSSDIQLIEKLVNVKRVVKVVKGGRRFRFSALVMVGDGKGSAGFGRGKAKEVPDAVKKAVQKAKSSMFYLSMREGRTLHHDIQGKFGAAKVIIRSAPQGTGVIAGGAMRALFEAIGVSDVVAKSIGTRNPDSLIRATLIALRKITTPKMLAHLRNKRISDVNVRKRISNNIHTQNDQKLNDEHLVDDNVVSQKKDKGDLTND